MTAGVDCAGKKGGGGMNARILTGDGFFGEGRPPVYVAYNEHHGKTGLHSHEFYELVFIKQGAALHSYENETQVLTTGDVFVILPGECHAYISASNTSLYNCLFTDEAFAGVGNLVDGMPGLHRMTIGRRESSTRIRAGMPEAQEILLCLEKMIWEQVNRMEGWELKLRSLLYGLLVLYARLYGHSSAAMEEPNANYRGILQAVAFMEENYSRDVPIDEVAGAAGLSAGYLSRQFKSMLGTSPSEYARSFRMAKAAEMLRDESLSVAAIAKALGFSEVSLLSRQFKQVTGLTPSGFRKNK